MWKPAFVFAAVVIAAPAALAHPAPEERVERLFNNVDGDANGVITQSELDDQRRSAFASVDADGDGFVTVEELRQLRAAVREFGGGERRGRRAGRGPRGVEDRPQLDADGDDRIALTEFLNRPYRMLEADADGDGGVTADELIAAMEARKAERRGQRPGSEN